MEEKQNGRPLLVARVDFLSKRLSLGQNGAGLVLERVLRDIHDFKECGVVGRSEIRNDFAVEFALRGDQAFDEAAVGDAGFAGGGIDARLPEVAVNALFCAAIALGVLPAVIHGVGSVAVKFGALEAEALGRRQHPFATFAGSGRIGDTHFS